MTKKGKDKAGGSIRMKARVGMHKMIWIGIILGPVCWLFDSAVRVFVLSDGTLIHQILSPSPNVSVARSIATVAFLAFGILAQSVVDRQAHAEMVLRANEQWLSTILKSIGDAVIVSDAGGMVTFMNPVAESLTGWTCGDAMGIPLEEVFNLANQRPDETDEAPVDEAIEESVGEPENHTYLISKDGKECPIDHIDTPIRDANGNVIGTVLVFRNISDRKRVEDERKNAEERLKLLFEFAPDPYYLTDLNGTFIDGNIAAERMTGFTKEELIGKNFLNSDLISAEQIPKATMLLTMSAFGNPTGPDEFVLTRKDGTKLTAEISTHPIKRNGQSLVIGIARDISERKRVEEALRKSKEEYSILVENATEAITVSRGGMLKFVNASAVHCMGYTRDELTSRSFIDFVHPDDQQTMIDRHWKLMGGEEIASEFLFRVIGEDGSVKWIEINSILVTWEGEPAALSFMKDVSESVRLTRELRESRDYLQGLVDNANDIIITCDQSGTILSANKKAIELSNFSADSEGRNIFEIIAPEFEERTRQWADAHLRGERVAPILQLEFVTDTGQRIPVETSLNVVESDGEIVGVQAIARDLRPRLEAERQIRELQVLNGQIVRNASLGIITIDLAGTITSVNPAYARIMGLDSANHLVGQNFFERPSVKKFHYGEALKKVLGGERIERTYELQEGTPGKNISIKVFGAPLTDEQGKAQGALIIIADVSRERELEKQLIQSEKLSSIGHLVSGVAHELNNPLTAIMGYSQLLSVNKDLPERSLDMSRKIQTSAQRCKKIVDNLLSFSRRKLPEKTRTDVNSLLDQTLELREYDLEVNKIEVRKHYGSGVRRISCDPDRLQQVFLNFINNAFDAMKEANGGGILEIRTYESENNSVVIEFVDDGPGVAESVRDRIFDPFITTKPIGKGTGLGLSLSYGIIQAHGGSIKLDNDYRMGARFIVEIPIQADDPEEPSATLSAGEPVDNDREILLVDDEEPILECMKLLLERHSYKVITASNGDEAKEILNVKDFDIIITDLRMPGSIDGRTLYEIVSKEKPELARRMIFVTGNATDTDIEEFLESVPNPHVKKPFTDQELISSITTAMTK